MMFTIAMVVLISAIFCFFSQEFMGFVKQVFAIKGATLILPLLFASWFVFAFEWWVLWVLYYSQEVLMTILAYLIKIIPSSHAPSIALVVLLSLLSLVPVFILEIMSRRKTFQPYLYPYRTSTFIWLTCVLLLMI